MICGAPIQHQWSTGWRGFGVARRSQQVGDQVEILPRAERGDLRYCHQAHPNPTRQRLPSPLDAQHLPDLEEAIHRFQGLGPIALVDLNVDIDAAQILQIQFLADLLM